MNVFLFLKGEFRRSRAIFAGLTLLLALALSVAVSVVQVERMIKQASIRAAEQFDILVGARGSRSALLLGTVYLRNEMLPLVPVSAMRRLSPKAGDVAWAAPLAFGDRAGRGALVGTTRTFVDQGASRPLAAGRNFSKPFEAVAGSASGLALGESFSAGHGTSALTSHEHKERFTVVGMLPETGTAWDRAVLVPIESLWRMHGTLQGHTHDAAPLEAWLTHDLSDLPGTSALVVKPTSIAAAYRIRQHVLNASESAADGSIVNLMAIFTGEALVELFAVFSAAARALKAFAACSAGTSLAAALLTGFVLAKLRERNLLLLRALGAPRRFVLASVWACISASVLFAALGALMLGTLLSFAAGKVIGLRTGIAMLPSVGMTELLVLSAVTAAGALFALIPAVAISRKRLL